MKGKLIICLIFIIILFIRLSAQETKYESPDALLNTKLSGLKIGEMVPNVLMTKIIHINDSVSSAKITDFNDKLLILDFMSVGCYSCIRGLVEKEKLQRTFGNKIKIFAVVGGLHVNPLILENENEGFMRKYLSAKNYLSFNGVKIPWVVENKELNNFFPHLSISHLIWIYKGKLVAITEQDYVTASNIQLILDDKLPNWPTKNDFIIPMDVSLPLQKHSPAQFNRFIAKNNNATILGMYQDGTHSKSGTIRDSISQTRRDYFINSDIIKLYKLLWMRATGNIPNLTPSHTILEVKNPNNFIRQEDSPDYNFVTRQNTLICFEVNSVDTGQTEKQQALHLISTLDALLGTKGRYEKRMIKCLNLYLSDNSEKYKSDSQNAYEFDSSITKNPDIVFDQTYIWEITDKMNQFYGNPPVFDKTNFKGLIKVKFKLESWQNIQAVRDALLGYGLNLKYSDQELNVFVLSESI